MTIDELLLALEASAGSDRAVSEAGALTSIAISLKRIADALERVVHSGREGGYVLTDRVVTISGHPQA